MKEIVVPDDEREVSRVVRGVRDTHAADPTAWQLAGWIVQLFAVAVVLGLIVGMVLGWGSVVVIRVN